VRGIALREDSVTEYLLVHARTNIVTTRFCYNTIASELAITVLKEYTLVLADVQLM